MKNKIGWCNLTWNPVWGCRRTRGCIEYCYARAIAKRFGIIRFTEEWKYRTEHNIDATRFKLQNSLDLVGFKPTFLHSQYNKKLPKNSQRIFVGSMSEIAHWKTIWVLWVLNKIEQHPQHVFQFLTKYPDVYLKYKFPDNCHLGVTVTKIPKNLNNERMSVIQFLNDTCFNNLKFISFEPLLERINFNHLDLRNIGWVIVGAETGNRRGRVTPKIEWLNEIVRHCRDRNIPIYLKDSLEYCYPHHPMREFPTVSK